MAKKRNLNGLPNILVQRYFSTLFWWENRYMADWIWNVANNLGVSDIEIDILNDSVAPKEMQVRPIIAQLESLRETMAATLTSNDFPLDFIVDARFTVHIPQTWKAQRLLLCKATMKDKDGRLYEGKTYTEQATETCF